MNTSGLLSRSIGLALLAALSGATAAELPYRGKLDDGGQPAHGRYDFRVRLFADDAGSKALGETIDFPAVTVSDGRFELPIDLDPSLAGREQLFADIEVRAADQGAFEKLPTREMVKGIVPPACWKTDGNDALDAGSFLGTLDALPLELRSNNLRVAQMVGYSTSPSVVYGSASNVATFLAAGATIGGGGAASAVNPDFGNIGPNLVTDGFGTVSGGASNRAGNNNGLTVDDAPYATVGGGQQNVASGAGSTVAGGGANTASGVASTIPGGRSNTASGQHSLAAGRRAKAVHDGAFVWADNTDADFASTAANQFLLRAGGGIGVGVAAPQAKLHMRSAVLDLTDVPANRATELLIEDADAEVRLISNGVGTYGSQFVLQEGEDGASSWFIYRETEGASPLPALGFSWGVGDTIISAVKSFQFFPDGTALKMGGGDWGTLSDLRLKKQVEPLTGALDKLLALEGVTFEYNEKAIGLGLAKPGANTGFVAQQVKEVMPEWVGETSDGYLFVEERGTTALMVEALRELREENARLEARLAALEKHLAK
jgi:hypothetical protein